MRKDYFLLSLPHQIFSKMSVENIISLVGVVLSLIGVVASLIYVAYKSGGFTQKIEKNREDINVLSADMKLLIEKVSRIEGFLIDKNGAGFAVKESPLRLSKKGEEVSEAIEAVDIIEESWHLISEKIVKKGITKESNPYDIQKACFEIGDNYSDFVKEERFEPLKSYAFEHGHNLYDYDIIFSILIRDKFFFDNDLSIHILKDEES